MSAPTFSTRTHAEGLERELSALRARLDAPCPDVEAQVYFAPDINGTIAPLVEVVPAKLARDLRMRLARATEELRLAALSVEQEQRIAVQQQQHAEAAERALADSKAIILGLSQSLKMEGEEVIAAQTTLAEAKEWKKNILSAIKRIPEYEPGKWAGDKEGWGFCFELLNFTIRDRAAARSERDRATREVERVRNSTLSLPHAATQRCMKCGHSVTVDIHYSKEDSARAAEKGGPDGL